MLHSINIIISLLLSCVTLILSPVDLGQIARKYLSGVIILAKTNRSSSLFGSSLFFQEFQLILSVYICYEISSISLFFLELFLIKKRWCKGDRFNVFKTTLRRSKASVSSESYNYIAIAIFFTLPIKLLGFHFFK